MRKTPVVLIVAFIMAVSAQGSGGKPIVLNGKSVIWSPIDNVLLYGSVGKSSGSVVWRLFNPKNGDEETLFFGKNISPVWSFDGKYIAFQDAGLLKISDRMGNVSDFATPVAAIDTIIWSPDSLKILYSGDNRIYLYDIASKNNSQVAVGRKPCFLPGNVGLLFTDDDFELYFMGLSGEKSVLLSNIDDYVVSPDGKTLAAYNGQTSQIILMKLADRSTNSISVTGNVQGLDIGGKGFYLIYSVEGSGISVRNLLTGKMTKVIDEGFAPKFSFDDSYLSYETPKQGIMLTVFPDIAGRMPVAKFFRISVGTATGVKKGDILEVYEERINPFNNTVTGFDKDSPKGKIRVIAENETYSIVEKVDDAGADLEINDAVVNADSLFVCPITGMEK